MVNKSLHLTKPSGLLCRQSCFIIYARCIAVGEVDLLLSPTHVLGSRVSWRSCRDAAYKTGAPNNRRRRVLSTFYVRFLTASREVFHARRSASVI